MATRADWKNTLAFLRANDCTIRVYPDHIGDYRVFHHDALYAHQGCPVTKADIGNGAEMAEAVEIATRIRNAF